MQKRCNMHAAPCPLHFAFVILDPALTPSARA